MQGEEREGNSGKCRSRPSRPSPRTHLALPAWGMAAPRWPLLGEGRHCLACSGGGVGVGGKRLWLPSAQLLSVQTLAPLLGSSSWAALASGLGQGVMMQAAGGAPSTGPGPPPPRLLLWVLWRCSLF